MAKANLTDKAVRAAKAPSGERIEIWDTGCKGLCLRVSDAGKVFFFRYRASSGRQPRVKLGDFSDEFSIADARQKANRYRVSVQDGGDPASEIRKSRARAKAESAESFGDLADKFLKASERGEWKPKGKNKRTRTIEDERGVLTRRIRPAFGKLAPKDIDRAMVRKLLNGMRDEGVVAQTVKTHAVIRQVFAYAISEEIGGVVFNPAVGFPSPVSMNPRVRVLTDDEFRRVWRVLVDPSGLRQPLGEDGKEGAKVTVGRPVRIILQLAALLLQRRGELAGMKTEELDLEAGLWLIPTERTKGGRKPHLVPLPPLAVTLIREAMKIAKLGQQTQPAHVFPARGGADAHVKPDSVTHALEEIYGALEIKDANLHDFRRTGSTALTSERLSISPFIRSKVLGHVTDTGGGAAVSSVHYDANSYIAEKRRALMAWESLLLEIVSGIPRPSNVSPMLGAVA